LATIRFGLDTLQEEDDPVLRKKFEKRIGQNVDEMILLVETLLNYARLDQNLIKLNKTRVDLLPILQRSVQLKQSEKINLSIDSHGLSKIEVIADANYLSMLINNLIQNAMQHCRSEVRIDINQQDKLVILSVADDGKGVPESERNRILKPFIRGSEASGKKQRLWYRISNCTESVALA
jgi:two-component system OmpR family sensor kinase